ncbi:MAG: hypothetical protein R2881_03290 [Eubacteriales bacterium]
MTFATDVTRKIRKNSANISANATNGIGEGAARNRMDQLHQQQEQEPSEHERDQRANRQPSAKHKRVFPDEHAPDVPLVETQNAVESKPLFLRLIKKLLM